MLQLQLPRAGVTGCSSTHLFTRVLEVQTQALTPAGMARALIYGAVFPVHFRF